MIRTSEDYYYWCCDWCDTENRVLWARVHEGLYCGACHRPYQAHLADEPTLEMVITQPHCC
ncbi:MAG TPA: hypothetical protein PLN25_00495 [Deltaproteobacteria bacterium]|nr:hypothetical protein [Deltaproteobacteria bacterium]HQB38273.1 hypothetical protein [Deltaproteobacteria bacterium]